MNAPGIALVGCGLIGRVHAEALRSALDRHLAAARLVVACDADIERARRLAASTGFAHAVDDIEAALSRPDVDAVFVCTPTSSHEAVLRQAVRRSLGVFCEKPLALTAQSAERMADLVDQARVSAQVGLVLRYSPLFQALRRALLDAAAPVGRPITAIFRDDQMLPIDGLYQSRWRGDAQVAGGGTLIEHSIHDLDILRWLLGEVVQVQATTSHFTGLTGIEDLGIVQLTFQSGVVAVLTSLWHQIPSRRSNRRLEIFCDRAWLHAEGEFGGLLEVDRGAGEPLRLADDALVSGDSEAMDLEAGDPLRLNGYMWEDIAFLRALSRGTPPRPSLREAVVVHRILDACYQSSRVGRPVDVSEMWAKGGDVGPS